MSSSLCGSPAPPGLLSPVTPSAHSSSAMSVSMGGAGNVSRLTSPVHRLILLEDDLDRSGREAESVMAHANMLKVDVTFCSDLDTFLSEDNNFDSTAFVLSDFAGDNFDRLHKIEATIFGPTAVSELAANSGSDDSGHPALAMSTRPLFCTSMRGLAVCFSGYRQKENKSDLRRLLFMIHSMGGRVLPDVAIQKPKVTHLVAKDCRGEKYTYATTFDIPVMQDGWITASWEMRKHAGFIADKKQFREEWRAKPFHGAKIHFLGFSESEREHMVEELLRNGGRECKDYRSQPCTHLVIDNNTVQTMPPEIRSDTHVVKSEWFWASIQMDACAEEKMHLFSDFIGCYLSPRPTYFSPSTPGSHSRRKKRRTEAVRQLAQNDGGALGSSSAQVPSTSKKARSSIGELTGHHLRASSGSFLLDTPDKKKRGDTASASSRPDLLSPPSAVNSLEVPQGVKSPSPGAKTVAEALSSRPPLSARHQVFAELVQTEENYVSILRTIVEVFKEPLEDPKMQLLNQTQMKIIFGNVPPILEVHQKMLGDLRACLVDWREEISIGRIVGKFAPDLLRVYPPFVNFFENTKKTVEECDKNIPRFHAFLKVCESRRECGRQTLTELLIRPVQRLGSVSLLLNDLLKHTRKEKDHPDIEALEKSIAKVKEVLTNINEDKRKTEGQVHIFEIFSEIENCPPHLVSSHRHFLCKVDVAELGGSDELCGKGSDLTLFLFSDVVEITKRRRAANRGLGSAGRSPSTMSLRNPGVIGPMGGGGTLPGQRPHKHVDLMGLSAIKRVVDLADTDESRDCFTLVCRTNQELKERMFVFQLVSDEMSKAEFLRTLCRNVANAMYRQDPDSYLVHMRPDDLGLATSDLAVNKAYKSLHRVKKAFSFNKTPTTNRLTRAVSSMISPLTANGANRQHQVMDHQGPGGARDRLMSTPSGDLQNLRLQSCSNLMTAESPVSSRSRPAFAPGVTPSKSERLFPMAPPPPSPARSYCGPMNNAAAAGAAGSESPRSDRGGFSMPRTPILVSRRASFKFLSSSLGKKRKE